MSNGSICNWSLIAYRPSSTAKQATRTDTLVVVKHADGVWRFQPRGKWVHVIAGTVAMSTQTLAPMAFGLRIVSGTGDRRYAVISLVWGAVAILALIVLRQGQSSAFPGLFQKIFQVAAGAWVLLSAIHLLGNWRTT